MLKIENSKVIRLHEKFCYNIVNIFLLFRKRKLVVDEIKAITGEEMKAQLSDTSDIVTTLGIPDR